MNYDMQKLFKLISRANTLIVFGVFLTGLIFIIWTYFKQSKEDNRLIQPPNQANMRENPLRLKTVGFVEKHNLWVLSADSEKPRGAQPTYEWTDSVSRNILILHNEKNFAQWLFDDQSQLIRQIEILSPNIHSAKKILFFVVNTIDLKSEQTNNNELMVYLTNLDTSKPVKVLSGVNEVVTKNLFGDSLYILYRNQSELRSARISLRSFKVLSDFPAAAIKNNGYSTH